MEISSATDQSGQTLRGWGARACVLRTYSDTLGVWGSCYTDRPCCELAKSEKTESPGVALSSHLFALELVLKVVPDEQVANLG